MRHKKLILPLVMFALFFGGAVSARALQSTTAQTKKVQVRAEFQTMKEKLAVKKCGIVQKQVKNRLQKFDNQYLIHLASYEKTKTLLTGKIEKIKARGYIVDTLTNDLVAYDTLIQTYKDDYAAYQTALTELKDMTCENTEGEIRTQLADAKVLLKKVHQDSVAIRTFWAKTMRLHYLELKQQKTAEAEDENTAETDTTEETTDTTTNGSGE